MSSELQPPTVDDFVLLKDALLEVAELPDAHVRTTDPSGQRIYIGVERLYADLDFLSWPPLTICMTGLLSVYGGRRSKMVLRYRELTHNSTTMNSSVNHDYILRREGSELVEYFHTMRGAPAIAQQRQDPRNSDEQFYMADEGVQLLRLNAGRNMELTTGDCGVLFDRMMSLANG